MRLPSVERRFLIIELSSIKEIGISRPLAASDLALIESGVRNCLRLNALIGSYLDAARLEEGALPLHASPVDLEPLIRNVIDELAPAARERGQEPTLTVHGTLIAHADPELLRRVLVNILSNATKFTPQGGRIDVTTSSLERDVLIQISDNGPGIPAQDLPRIFDRFYQGVSPGRRSGLGLGLTFCRAATRAMGGEVTAESEEGKGSVFTLRLPQPILAGTTI